MGTDNPYGLPPLIALSVTMHSMLTITLKQDDQSRLRSSKTATTLPQQRLQYLRSPAPSSTA